MGSFQSFLDVFKKNSEIESLFDLEILDETSERVYLKRMAVDTVLNYVGRTVSISEFRFYKDGKIHKDTLYYKFNVRPNQSNSAATFWQKVIYKLMYDNEVLIVKTDADDFVIADNFNRKENTVLNDTFTKVTVKEYEFKKTFNMNEVIYMEYNNEKLNAFLDGLHADYGQLMARMIDASLRNNQIRGTVDIDSVTGLDEKTAQKLQRFVKRTTDVFSKRPVAIIPQTKQFKYSEVSGKGRATNQTVNDVTKLKNELVNEVAKAVGVPPTLIHGDVADLSAGRDAYKQLCIKPLLKKIENELNAKLFEPNELISKTYVNVVGIDKPNIFEAAPAMNNLIGSGPFSPNEIRVELGYEPDDNPAMDKHYITKNYADTADI